MSAIDTIKQPVIKEFEQFDKQFKRLLKSDVFLLNLITRYVLKTKGKQLRPILVLLSAKIFGAVGKKTYAAASLVELLHTASLVHDDVVDEANMRRGFLSLHVLWNSKTAVLFGDYLLGRGLMISVENEAFDLLYTTSVAVKEMSEGELLQLEYSIKQHITRDEYFELIRKKTASLMAACTEAGAQSAGAMPEDVHKMRQFGICLGMIFQIRDDVLDYQPTGIMGKQAGNDLKEKKFTLPLILALEQSPVTEQKRILKLMGNNASNAEKLSIITRFIMEKKGVEGCYAVMNEIAGQAEELLRTLPQNEATTALKKTIAYATQRKN
ncbi:MAG: polyprenyl synthetase family protein [Bacteroidales bacterium]|nr:polyprenyl synthetase family protein [Bacteroidales bacterium]